MKRHFDLPHVIAALLVVVAALFSAAMSHAQSREARSALIIGISKYGTPGAETLEGVKHDVISAQRIAEAMGIPASRTVVVRDEQATRDGILRALDKLAAGAAPGGRVLIYYSGHGARVFDATLGGCREALLAYDGQMVSHEDIARRTRRIGEVSDKLLVFFDACHSAGVSTLRGASEALSARSITGSSLKAKYSPAGSADPAACQKFSNYSARGGLLQAATRLGTLAENMVEITSSRADEVSWDDKDKGGLATQGVRDCLLGKAVDTDGSGATTLGEIQACAQKFLNDRFRSEPAKLQHVSIKGNRNLIVATAQRPPVLAQATAPQAVTPAQPAATAPAPAPTPPPAATPVAVAPSPPVVAAPVAPPAPAAPPPVVEPALASLATLKDIEAQRDPRWRVSVTPKPAALRIGRDRLNLTIKSGFDGHVYIVLLGTDRKSFSLLFPNGLDRDNRIKADVAMVLPRPDWTVTASGPAGTDELLVMVSETPRDLSSLNPTPPDAKEPFVFTLNDLPGRGALIDFLTGRGVTERSERFGAARLTVKEVK